jgi:hypothetical protein
VGSHHLTACPDTASWRRVVGLLADGSAVATVAAATTAAALEGLAVARQDGALDRCFLLLLEVALAGRSANLGVALRDVGLAVPDDPNLFDIVAGFNEAVLGQFARAPGRTDLADLALSAASEALTAQMRRRSDSLFGTGPDDVRAAARELSANRGFGTLIHEFFSRFTCRFLTYHLARELSQHVGGNGRFPDPAAHNLFLKELGTHAAEAAVGTRKYASDWYSLHNYRGDLTPELARNFVDHCLQKITEQIEERGRRG